MEIVHGGFEAGASEKGCSQYLVGVLCYKNLSETMQSFFLSKQSLLKSLIQKSAAEAPPELAPWHSGMTKRQEEKSQRLHQQRVELYHHIQDLAAKKIDVATIARKLGVSRQTVYTYLHMRQPEDAHADSSRRQTAH